MIIDAIQTADEFFAELGMGQSPQGRNAKTSQKVDPNIADSDGLVTYVTTTTDTIPDELKDLQDEVAGVLEDLVGVLVTAATKIAADKKVSIHDPSVWKTPLQHLCSAFCGPLSESSEQHDETIKGVEFSTTFLKMLIDTAVAEGPGMKDFEKFLESQGDTIKVQAQETKDGYHQMTISQVHEIVQSGSQFHYVPKFKFFFTNFSEKTFDITSCCASYEEYELDFWFKKWVSEFKIETWKTDPKFREKVRNFCSKFNDTAIADSDNYFSHVNGG